MEGKEREISRLMPISSLASGQALLLPTEEGRVEEGGFTLGNFKAHSLEVKGVDGCLGLCLGQL